MKEERVFPFMIKLILVFIAFLGLAAGLLVAAKRAGIRDDLPISQFPERTFVIDAGHGGRDGGAVGISGAVEKDIDLAISKKVYLLITLCGRNAIMTRTQDEMLDLPGTQGNLKGRDIRSRIKIADETPDSMLVSIHVNSFPSEKYRGFQVFYSTSDPASQITAERIRQTCTRFLPEAGNREIKQASSSIYLLNNVKSPAILIECGFISNAEEEKLLCDNSYQNRLCAVICSGLISDAPSENKDSGV